MEAARPGLRRRETLLQWSCLLKLTPELQRTSLPHPDLPPLDSTSTCKNLGLSRVSPGSRVTQVHALLDCYTDEKYFRSCPDKDMENFGGCFWLVAWWGAWEVLGAMGKEGSELRCPEPPQGWNVVNKGLLLPALIVGSFLQALCEWAPVSSVTE